MRERGKRQTAQLNGKHHKHDTKFLNEKDKASAETQRWNIHREHAEGNETGERDGWGRITGGMIYLYSVQGGVQKNRHFTWSLGIQNLNATV